jgi:hypothetical protein
MLLKQGPNTDPCKCDPSEKENCVEQMEAEFKAREAAALTLLKIEKLCKISF